MKKVPIFAQILQTGALAAFAVAGVASLQPRAAHAMTVLQVDLKQLVTTADLVLHGTISRVQVLDRRKEGRGVWTEFTLNVADVWKGDAKKVGATFSWRHVGGTTADGMTVAVPGMPAFAVGEETVVILEKTSDNWVVSGGPQGKYTVNRDKAGRKTVLRDVQEVYYLRKDPATGGMQPAPKQVQIVRFLSEFRDEVAGYAAADAKTRAPVGPAKTAPTIGGKTPPVVAK